MNKGIVAFVSIVVLSSVTFAQYKIHSGLYTLGTADKPTSEVIINLPFIEGVVIRTQWEKVEKNPGQFDWSYIDSEVGICKKFGKKAVIQILGSPGWIRDSLGAEVYYYLDKNEYHPTFGDTLFDYIPWNTIYIQRLEKLIVALGSKYSTDTSIASINTVAGSISRNLPEKIADGRNFWEAFKYHPDTLVSTLCGMVDIYMKSFPQTPLWSSMDYVSFETKATGKNRNYVCGEYAKYGVAHYPDRFGLWREDISGCTLYPPNAGSQWSVMNAYSERTGAQMLWHVQDGPARMNQCGILDSSKAGVMKAALERGRKFGMRYFEIYGIDVKDTSLHAVLTSFADQLHSAGSNSVGNTSYTEVHRFNLLQNYPNPFNPSTTISFTLPATGLTTLKIYDSMGREVATLANEIFGTGEYHQKIFDASRLASGMYVARLTSGSHLQMKRMVLLK